MEITSNKITHSDLLGATASGLCAIHCALTPLFFAAKPVLESTADGHTHCCGIWALFDYVFLVLSLVAVWYSAQHTTRPTIKWVLWIAWLIFAGGLLSESFNISFGKWFMYVGSIILVAAHLQNYRHCKNCKNRSSSDLSES